MLRKNKVINKVIISLVIVFACAAIAVGVAFVVQKTYAKYVLEKQTSGTVVAGDFYFESDLLDETTPEYTINSAPTISTTTTKSGETEKTTSSPTFTFVLKNYADNLRYNEDDTNFEISAFTTSEDGSTISEDLTITVDGKQASTGTLAGKQQSEATVVLSGFSSGKTYTVSVTGTTIFTKTITAKIIVHSDGDGIYKYEDNSNSAYVLLTIWTKDITEKTTLTITCPAGLVPDNTHSGMEDWKTSTQGYSVTVEAYSSYTFRFFKTSEYTGSITVTYDNDKNVQDGTLI
jgi:hypothetical protein